MCIALEIVPTGRNYVPYTPCEGRACRPAAGSQQVTRFRGLGGEIGAVVLALAHPERHPFRNGDAVARIRPKAVNRLGREGDKPPIGKQFRGADNAAVVTHTTPVKAGISANGGTPRSPGATTDPPAAKSSVSNPTPSAAPDAPPNRCFPTRNTGRV